jgi:hypothetical protein
VLHSALQFYRVSTPETRCRYDVRIDATPGPRTSLTTLDSRVDRAMLRGGYPLLTFYFSPYTLTGTPGNPAPLSDSAIITPKASLVHTCFRPDR